MRLSLSPLIPDFSPQGKGKFEIFTCVIYTNEPEALWPLPRLLIPTQYYDTHNGKNLVHQRAQLDLAGASARRSSAMPSLSRTRSSVRRAL